MVKPALRIVRDEATQSAQIFIYGIIGDFWAPEDHILSGIAFQKQLTALADVPVIHVHINSPGGDVLEGLAIANAIKASTKEIHTHNDGICASMGAVILASAKQGNRHAAKGSLTMFHSASTFSWGNASQMRDDAIMLEKHDDVLAEIVADAMGKTPEEIKAEYFDGKDHWLTAKDLEALDFLTISNYDATDVPDNATAVSFSKVAAHYKQPTQQNKNENMFGINKFKSLSALAKVAVADINADQVKAINEEIVAEGIHGVTVVQDSELEKVTAEADKVPDLTQKVTDLEAKADEDATEIANLEAKADEDATEIANLKAKVADLTKKPAASATTPQPNKPDVTPAPPKVEDSFETSYDREIKAALK